MARIYSKNVTRRFAVRPLVAALTAQRRGCVVPSSILEALASNRDFRVARRAA